jgi:hypothetical protein
MQYPGNGQENDSEEIDENNNDLAGNASGNIPDEYYDELNEEEAGSGTADAADDDSEDDE